MDWQQITSLGIVATAAAGLLRSKLKPRKAGWEKDTHCGCAVARQSTPPLGMVYRARRGERPQIVAKLR